MTTDTDRARALLHQPELAWIVERCRGRLARGQPLTGTATLADATAGERDALDRLLGRRPTTGTSLQVDLGRLEEVLRRAGIAGSLEDAVLAVTGPITDIAAAREAEAARWVQLYDELDRRAESVAVAAFVEELRATGLLRRLADDADHAGRLADATLRVLAVLPADGVTLARFAADLLHDSHALDPGAPLTTLVLRGVEHLTGHTRADRSVHERRALWASVGVLCDELSAPALVLGLEGHGDGPTDALLATSVAAGEPLRLTLRQLVRNPPRLGARIVHVCENPAVVASAADRLGAACPPLVCTDGVPASAVQTLLGLVVGAGAELRVHTDLDWGGVRIANLIIERFGARPWRMGTADYLAAPPGVALHGRPVEATWDGTLTAAMHRRGTAVHEEQLLPTLLEDLGLR